MISKICEKMAESNDIENAALSTGMAARGHILEQYAIQEFNTSWGGNSIQIQHWDDILVHQLPKGSQMVLSFSPDGMNVSPPQSGAPSVGIDWFSKVHSFTLVEVKSYSLKHHMQCQYVAPDKAPERYQLATAMEVLPFIAEAYLLYYNPSAPDPFRIRWLRYDRVMLKTEREEVNMCVAYYNRCLKFFNESVLYTTYAPTYITFSEEDIAKQCGALNVDSFNLAAE